MRSIKTEYAGHLFRSRLEARWAVFLDACRANWEYEPEGYVLNNRLHYLPDFLVHDVRFYRADGMSVSNVTIEVKGTMDRASEAKVKAYADKRPILVLGGLPHGPNYAANLVYGLEGVGAVALLEQTNWRFVVPGIDDDGRLALFDAVWPAFAHLDSTATQVAYAKAVKASFEFGRTPKPSEVRSAKKTEPVAEDPAGSLNGLSREELDAIRDVVRQGFAHIDKGVSFKREFLAKAGLDVVVYGKMFVLVVRDEKVFAPYRQTLLHPVPPSGVLAFKQPNDAERFAIQEIAEKGFTVSADNPYLGKGRRYSRRFIRTAGLMTGRRRGRFGLMVGDEITFTAYLAMLGDPLQFDPSGTHVDEWNPKKEDES